MSSYFLALEENKLNIVVVVLAWQSYDDMQLNFGNKSHAKDLDPLIFSSFLDVKYTQANQ